MDICKERIYAVLIFLFLAKGLFAQDFKASIYLNDTDKTIKVIYSNGEKYLPELIQFPKNSKNNYFQNTEEIKTVYNDTVEEMREFETGKDFELRKHTNSLELLFETQNVVVVPTAVWLHYNNINLLNIKEILFTEDADYSIEITLYKDGKTPQNLGIKTYKEWVENPLELASSTLFLSKNHIDFYTNNPSSQLKEELEILLEKFTYLYIKEAKPKKIYLVFGNDSLPTGGNTFENSAVVYIDDKTNGENKKLTFQRTLLHELYHWISPYKIYPEMEGKEMDKNWLSEATPEYFSLYYLLKNGFVTDKQFLGIMEEKMRESNNFANQSLFDMSLDVYHHPENYAAFYSKGTLAVFLIDLKLYALTNGTLTLENLSLGNYPEIDEKMELDLNNGLHDMEEILVNNKNPFPYNDFLSPFGFLYEKRVVLPMNENSKEAIVKNENIISNKMATQEQKSRWQSFIKN